MAHRASLPLILALATGCAGAPFEGSADYLAPEQLPAAGATAQDLPQAGAPQAIAGSAGASLAGFGGQGGQAQAGSGGRAGEAPGGFAGMAQGGAASAGAPAAGSAGQGQAGSPPTNPDACEPPSQDGPLSGARDCTADCADGTVPCTGSCGDMQAGGCSGTYTVGVADADFSFVLDAGDAWAFDIAGGMHARLTAMPGVGSKLNGKAQVCLVLYAEELERVLAVLAQRGWVRVETSAQPLVCP